MSGKRFLNNFALRQAQIAGAMYGHSPPPPKSMHFDSKMAGVRCAAVEVENKIKISPNLHVLLE